MVIKWHRQGFRLYWRWKSRKKMDRPAIPADIHTLIRHMARENPTWGAPRIQSELHLLGYTAAESTVAKYMGRPRKAPSQTWRTFLENHVPDIAAIYFFVVPTVTFRLLYCFVVLHHHGRRIVHFNVTQHTAARWTAQQIIEAFPYDEASRFLIVFNEDHLLRILTAYFSYHHESRTHLSLRSNAPIPREVEHPNAGKVISISQVSWLHHRYSRAA